MRTSTKDIALSLIFHASATMQKVSNKHRHQIHKILLPRSAHAYFDLRSAGIISIAREANLDGRGVTAEVTGDPEQTPRPKSCKTALSAIHFGTAVSSAARFVQDSWL